jgi:hypothetical protein
MTEPYPVGVERPLDATSRRKLLGMSIGGKSRSSRELPTTTPHEVLVYRVGGRFRLDEGLGLSHEDVVNASHVSSVDMTHDKQVVVEIPIPSRDSEMFHLLVTFMCTVTEPLLVVERGINAEHGLLTYLKSHHEIVHLGLKYPLAEINEVRIDAEAEITSLASIRPPALPGMFVTLASVEVATPTELIEFHQKLRGLQRSHTLESVEQGYQQNLEQGRREYENETALTQQRHEHDLDHERTTYENQKAFTQQDHEQLLGFKSQRHDLSSRQLASEFARQEMLRARELLGTDPLAALQYALHAGRMDEREYAAELQADADRQRAIEQRRADQAHDESMLQLQWDQEAKLRAEHKAEENQNFVRAIKLELLRDLGKRGYLDTIDPETLATELLGELTTGSSSAPASAQLPAADANRAAPVAPAPAGDRPSVREEDGD